MCKVIGTDYIQAETLAVCTNKQICIIFGKVQIQKKLSTTSLVETNIQREFAFVSQNLEICLPNKQLIVSN